jgi:hypothetical protein
MISMMMMEVIARIVFTDGYGPATVIGMYTPAPTSAPISLRRSTRDQASVDPWLLWRAEAPAPRDRLSVAELAECRCPDLCDRDHDNE